MERYCETESTRDVLDVLRALPSMGGLAVICGPHGVGKTVAVRAAAETLPNVRRLRLRPAAAGASPRAFFRGVAERLGVTVERSAGVDDLATAIETLVRRDGLLLVIDQGERMPGCWLPHYEYLADELGHLVVVGAPTLVERVACDEGLSGRVQLMVQATPVDLMQAARYYAEEFDSDWVRQAHEDTGGIWRRMAGLVKAERMHSAALGRSTLEATAADARTVAARFLLRAA